MTIAEAAQQLAGLVKTSCYVPGCAAYFELTGGQAGVVDVVDE